MPFFHTPNIPATLPPTCTHICIQSPGDAAVIPKVVVRLAVFQHSVSSDLQRSAFFIKKTKQNKQKKPPKHHMISIWVLFAEWRLKGGGRAESAEMSQSVHLRHSTCCCTRVDERRHPSGSSPCSEEMRISHNGAALLSAPPRSFGPHSI